MIGLPALRFVRHRLPSRQEGHHATVTFLASPADAAAGDLVASWPAGANSGDPGRDAWAAQRLAELARRNDEFMAWLERDSANGQLFLGDPVAAIHAAFPDLPADFFQAWGKP